ncbi:LysR family transcriptional regulator [Uliginosibacterium sp. TH139]|uniref:LysR family transcriptional regulator n=1 Tax=Uliginosibacterium sp. TH139 TaxID=2067453 RepID=UPI000C7CDCF4|nr:LysR family transcriptional regulator [Uliginosibacterium sp. TH139]PLK48081.1 LysR family transcriptional regulator [Uliginosibacterium sp. TH139]
MQIRWIEDFLTLADARAFSKAAESRNVSQPTLSRHVQALEDWLGVQLIDRREHGVQLTTAGRIFRGFAADMLKRTYEMRTVLRGQVPSKGDTVRFSVAHTLSLTYFPRWLRSVKERLDSNVITRVGAVNIPEGVAALIEGASDLLIIYHHPQLPILLDPKRFSYLPLGTDRLLPFSAPREDGGPLFSLNKATFSAIPFLAYAPGSYLAHAVEMILLGAPERIPLERNFDTHMAEALKAMIVEGHGLGWLPESCVTHELAEKQLAVAGSPQWSCPLEVRLYRANDNGSQMAERIWNLLQQEAQK